MSKKARTVPAGQFKARCHALLDEIATTGRPVVVTRRGKPVAKLVPIEGNEPSALLGSVVWEDDIVSPIDERWVTET